MKFNAEKEVKNIVEFIKNYYKKCNLKGVVIGISGGKDSGVVSALFCKAIGSENVLGVTLPCHSIKKDKSDAELISEKFGFELLNVDLTDVYDTFINEAGKLGTFSESETLNSNINIKPRLRMSTLYYLAALYTNIKKGGYIVAGTGNKCELYVGYFTKGGDSTFDIGVINDYTVDEVIKMGEYLYVPHEVLYKAPMDGLSGHTDEENMGVPYKDIASYMKDKNSVSEEIGLKIKRMHNNSRHKFKIPLYRR